MLVFDMGGATINATVVKATKNHQNRGHKYNIDILGKMGYGIGGDTIDYCLIKFLLSFTKDYPELKAISIEKNKDALATFATELKFKMVENSIFLS